MYSYGTEVSRACSRARADTELTTLGKHRYAPGVASVELNRKILNVIPGDYNHDGRLDLLIMTEERNGGWWGGEKIKVDMQVLLGATAGGFGMSLPLNMPPTVASDLVEPDQWILNASTDAQAIVFDADGTLKPSLLAYEPQESGEGTLKLWHNDGSGMTLYAGL